jgi:hypothetical protein
MPVGKGKSTKAPIGSPLGRQMEGVLSHMKHHKSTKSQHGALLEMHDMVRRRPPREMLKCAYEMGWKHAEEEALPHNQDDDPNSVTGPKNEEEAIVDTIRRGWPNPLDKAMRTHNKIQNKQSYASSATTKERAKINDNSPDVTV